MRTSVYKINSAHPTKDALKGTANILSAGGVAIIPTDTVYGLAANAFNLEAQKKIYLLKGRSFRKPLVIMPPDIDAVGAFAEVSDRARRVMEAFWPGPLTLILPTTALGRMLMGGRHDVGVRIPKHPAVQALLKKCGFPLATTSANPSSKPSAKTVGEAQRYFDAKVDVIIDAGVSDLGHESTVIDMTHFHCVVVREGSLNSKKVFPYL